ncbi:hypothetical protein [Paenibacillus xylanexedens]|uniref:hypothetical protein n=1 Tax=Paenibacillus xylanexedens TaxID=528191 RepID=UPI0011A6D415|nr:hypothetical protein [Paenibacillus xylanexedens]
MFEQKFLVRTDKYFTMIREITQVWEDGVEFTRSNNIVDGYEEVEVEFWGDEEDLFHDLLSNIFDLDYVKEID